MTRLYNNDNNYQIKFTIFQENKFNILNNMIIFFVFYEISFLAYLIHIANLNRFKKTDFNHQTIHLSQEITIKRDKYNQINLILIKKSFNLLIDY